MNRLYHSLIGPLALLAAICCVAPGNAAEVVLHQRVYPTGTVVLLGDVAEIHATGDVEARRLARMPLWPAPAPGEQRHATATAIRDTLRLRGIDTSPLRFAGAQSVTVFGSSAPASPQASPPVTRDFAPSPTSTTVPTIEPSQRYAMVGSNLPPQGTGLRPPRQPLTAGGNAVQVLTPAERQTIAQRVRRDVVRYLEEQTGNVGNIDVDLRLSSVHTERLSKQTGHAIIGGGQAPWVGRQTLTVEFATPQGSDQLTMLVDVLDTTPILIAKRPIARGQMLTAADVALESPSRDTRIPTGQMPLVSLEEVLQKEAARAIRPGEALTGDMCLMPLMIQRNQPVTVEMAGGGFRVSRQAIGISDARLGDYTEVQLLESKERLSGRVVGSGRLTVVDAGSIASRAVPGEVQVREKRYQP